MELKQISEKCFLYQTQKGAIQADILLVRLSSGAIVFVDTGAAPCPELFEELERRGSKVTAALCTHLHWDHTANNAEIFARGGRLFADAKELIPYASDVPQIKEHVEPISGNEISLEGEVFTFLPAYGHSPGHSAIVTPDGVCFIGDAFMTANVLKQAKIPYMDDTAESLLSMEKLRQTDYSLYVAAHCGVIRRKELNDVIDQNVQKEIDLYQFIRKLVGRPMTIDEIFLTLMDTLEITSPKVRERLGWHLSIEKRVKELVFAGELEFRDGLYIPTD